MSGHLESQDFIPLLKAVDFIFPLLFRYLSLSVSDLFV